jgi:RNA polymerase sigma-70 factor (ECF subfamily)
MQRAGDDTVRRVLEGIRARGATESVRLEADRVLARAEPVARQVCRRQLRGVDEGRLDELVQRVLEIVWSKLERSTAQDAEALDRWVRGVARNVCRNDRRKGRELLAEDGVFDVADPALGVLSTLQLTERDRVMQRAIERLPGSEQDVLYHRYVQELSQPEIAVLMGLGGGDDVRKLLQQAKRHLRPSIEAELEACGHGPSLLRPDPAP